MKKLQIAFSPVFLFLGIAVVSVNAQTIMGRSFDAGDWSRVVEHTLREEKEGKELWERFQAKEISCPDISDEQFGFLGEYFMGQMTGDSHAAMNAMIIQAHGENGEEQIHIVIGKRFSGCDKSASLPAISGGWMPMMNIMMGRRSLPFGFNQSNPMMWGFGNNPMGWSLGVFGWIFMILWLVLIIAGIIALIKWLIRQSRGAHLHEKSALDILRERYAKGEIDKKEFEEKKEDLS